MLFSIITPCFNKEKYVESFIRSVANQTIDEKEFELILVDDGSTDNTRNVILKNLSLIKNVCLLSQNNLGTLIARDKGVRHSKGDYLLFFDCDDEIDERTLSILKTTLFIANFPDIVMFRYKTINVDGSSYISKISFPNILTTDKELMMMEKFNTLCNKLYKRCLYRMEWDFSTFKNCLYNEDMCINSLLVLNARNAYEINEVLYYYKLSSVSSTNLVQSRLEYFIKNDIHAFMLDNMNSFSEMRFFNHRLGEAFGHIYDSIVSVIVSNYIIRAKKHFLLLIFNSYCYQKYYSLYKDRIMKQQKSKRKIIVEFLFEHKCFIILVIMGILYKQVRAKRD